MFTAPFRDHLNYERTNLRPSPLSLFSLLYYCLYLVFFRWRENFFFPAGEMRWVFFFLSEYKFIGGIQGGVCFISNEKKIFPFFFWKIDAITGMMNDERSSFKCLRGVLERKFCFPSGKMGFFFSLFGIAFFFSVLPRFSIFFLFFRWENVTVRQEKIKWIWNIFFRTECKQSRVCVCFQ